MSASVSDFFWPSAPLADASAGRLPTVFHFIKRRRGHELEMHEGQNWRARRRAENTLKDSETELRALFEAMTDVVLVLDGRGRFLKIAPTDPSHLFKPPSELRGKTLHEIFTREQADFLLEHIRAEGARGLGWTRIRVAKESMMASILLVEDDDQLRTMLKELLTSSGYEVCEATNGTGVCEMYEKQHFDLVITDLVMPSIEGLEVIMDLRRIDRAVRIIAISGGGQNKAEDYLEIAQKLGAQFTLSKPFSNQEILGAVCLALETQAYSDPTVDGDLT
ncbi:MAG TPA: response regulator [Pyrinomonadaceae bacterium]|nr:response regulator [Pyrinomonadaceae bacterium]